MAYINFKIRTWPAIVTPQSAARLCVQTAGDGHAGLQAHRAFLKLWLPLYWSLTQWRNQYGDDDFDMQRYLSLQAAFRSSFAQLSGPVGKRKGAANRPEATGFDLGGILGRQ